MHQLPNDLSGVEVSLEWRGLRGSKPQKPAEPGRKRTAPRPGPLLGRVASKPMVWMELTKNVLQSLEPTETPAETMR